MTRPGTAKTFQPLVMIAMLALSIQLHAAKLLFDASFDKGTSADKSGGEAAHFSHGDTGYPLVEGLHGKAVRIGTWKGMMTPGTMEVKDRAYHWQYRAGGNIDYRKGAVSFWVSPGDWEGASNPDNKMLFHASCNDDAALFIFKPSPDARIIFYMKNYARTAQAIVCPVDDWRKGEWHHIVYNWTDGQADFFVDGNPAASIAFPAFGREFTSFCIGNVGFRNETGGSLMDELKIFDEPLTEEEIGDLFYGTADDLAASTPVIGVGKSDKAPVLDGVVQDGEYPLNATGFLDYGTGQQREPYASYSMAHDGEWLYIAVKSTLPEGYVKSTYGRDANLWEDESIEIHLDVKNGKQYQFILNPLGNIYDSCEKDSAWNAKSIKAACGVEHGVWQCECAVRLEDLGIADRFGVNIARSYKSPARLTCIANVRAAIGYADPQKYLQATLLPSAVPSVSLSALSTEEEMALLTTRGLTPGKVNASVVFKTVGKAIAKHDFTLNCNERTVVQTNLPNKAFADVTLTAPDGNTILRNTFDVSKSTLPPISLKYIYTDMETDTVKFVLHRLGRHGKDEKIQIDFSTLDGKPAKSKTCELAEENGTLTLDFEAAGMPVGFYDVVGTHIVPGEKPKVIFKEAWRMPDKHAVPDYFAVENIRIQPPWTELTTNDDIVNCLGREYRFNGDLLLKSISSQGTQLLSDGMSLVVDGAKAIPEKPAAPRFENHGAYCFVHQDAKYGSLLVSTDCRVDYDGLVKVKLRLVPPSDGVSLKSLQLAIPFNAEIAEFVNGGTAYGKGTGQTRALGANDSWNCNLYSTLLFWIGDREVGISFAFKNLRGWHCQDAVNSLAVKTEGRQRTVYLNIVDTPFLLKEPRTIEFALLATPAKNTSAKVLRTRFCEWDMWSDHFSAYFDYPELPFLTDKTNADNGFHYNAFGTSPHSPDWNYYHKLWHTGVMGAIREDFHIDGDLKNLALRNRDQYVFGCFDTPSFLDFKIRQMQFVLSHKPFNTQNLYFDLVSGLSCASADHGCAWTDDFGRTWGSMDWEGRVVYLRLTREMLLKKNPNGLISLHSHCHRTPSNAYGDIQVGGEDFVGEVGMNGNYYGIVDSEVLCAHSNAFGFGMKKVFIPQFERSLLFVKPGEHFDWGRPDNIKAGRHLLTMLFAHDIDPWAPGNPVAQSIWKLEKDFGWDGETAFAPKWKTGNLYSIAKDDSNGALVAGMFHRKGRALLAVVNDCGADNAVRIRLDARRLLSKETPFDVRPFFQPKRDFRIVGDTIEMQLTPREAEILWIE